MGKVSNDRCFCSKRQTLNHILNCCRSSLNQGRFTFRHDNILQYISKCLDKEKYKCYVDIDGHQTPAGGTLPPNVIVTNLKPDITIINKRDKTISIFELTVPSEQRIDTANKLKIENTNISYLIFHPCNQTSNALKLGLTLATSLPGTKDIL